MTHQNLMAKNRCGRKLLNGLCFFFLIPFLSSCVAIIPAAIVYKKNRDGVVVTAEVDVDADKVYQTALNNIEKKAKMKIVEQDDEQRLFRAEKMIDEKKNQATLTVTAIDDNRSRMVATGNLPGRDEEAEKKLALQIIKNVCEALGVKYEVVEEEK